MKKLTLFALTAAMLLSLAACGSSGDTGVVGSVTAPAETTDVSGSVSTPEPAAETEEPAAETEEPTATAAPEEAYEFGSMNGGIYENDFIGIGCELDSNWTYLSDEEIMELNGIVADSIDDEEVSAMLKDTSIIRDMYATADGGLVSINISFENLGVLYGITLDESAYIDVALESFGPTMEAAGFSDLDIQKSTTQFAGEERQCISLSATYSDVMIYEELVCIKQGNYMAVITFACYGENIIPELESYFYTLDA